MRLTLNTQILLGALLGLALGWGLQLLEPQHPLQTQALYWSGLLGTLFTDLLKMVLIPLVFSSIAVGVAHLRQHQQMHRVWRWTLGFFVLSMALAMLLGFAAMHWLQPGAGLRLHMFASAIQHYQAQNLTPALFLSQFLHGLFTNPFAALSQGSVLPVLVSALLLGWALVMGGERYQNILNLLEEVLDLSLWLVRGIMRLAPVGLMALLLQLVLKQNLVLLSQLGEFVLLILATTVVHGAVVLPLLLYLSTGMKPMTFFKGSREALLTAFATSSSSATIPVTLRCVQNHLGVHPDIARFVVPLGATINMDGTALYEAAAALFVANLAGIELSLVQQGMVFVTAMVAAMGAPGIPSAGMVTMIMVLQSVGLPVEAIAILLPVDRVLDTVRTAVNVEGDMIGSVIVQRFVGAQKFEEQTSTSS